MVGKKILFRGFDLLNRGVGFADVFDYSFICYLKGKDMGYDDIHIIFPRFGATGHEKYNISEESYNYQETKFLPWKWYPRNKEIRLSDWDEIIDTTKPDTLYKGFPGIGSHFWHTSQYLSLYYAEKGIPPYLKAQQDCNGKHYIIFHYRGDFPGGYYSKERVTSINEFKYIFNIIKNLFVDEYEYWKIGDPCPIDNEFDNVIPPMYDNMDGFVELLFNSSLLVASHSGPMDIAYCISDLPIIIISIFPPAFTFYSDSWAKILGNNKKTNRHPTWCTDKLLCFNKGVLPDENKIKSFLNKHNLLRLTIAIDIDGVLCEETHGDYKNAVPFIEAIDKVNKLYYKGHHILIYTARGSRTGIDWREFTEKQLQEWNVKYHELKFGKPHYNIFIEDKAIASVDELDNQIF